MASFRQWIDRFIRLGLGRPKPSPCQESGQPESVPLTFLAQKILSGKTALVTGAGQNIGRSIALEMALQGAYIVAVDKNASACVKVAQDISNLGGKCRPFILDITQVDSIDQMLSDLRESSTKVDILVNNVGITPQYFGLDNLSSQHFRDLFEVNVFSPLDLTQKIARELITCRQPGVVLFVTSIHGAVPSRWMAYSSSKAALSMMIKELALELSGCNIRVNGIAPGWVTEDELGAPKPHPYTPLKQSSINPCYIGRAAVYLASEYFSRFTTGITLTVDGGLSLYNSRTREAPPPRFP